MGPGRLDDGENSRLCSALGEMPRKRSQLQTPTNKGDNSVTIFRMHTFLGERYGQSLRNMHFVTDEKSQKIRLQIGRFLYRSVFGPSESEYPHWGQSEHPIHTIY